jgi:hypothetical protein
MRFGMRFVNQELDNLEVFIVQDIPMPPPVCVKMVDPVPRQRIPPVYADVVKMAQPIQGFRIILSVEVNLRLAVDEAKRIGFGVETAAVFVHHYDSPVYATYPWINCPFRSRYE